MSDDILLKLADRFAIRAKELNQARAISDEEATTRRSLVVIYSEVADMIREELREAHRMTLDTIDEP